MVLLILALMASAGLTAQRITGDITGTVIDGTQAVVPGATITGACTATGLMRTTTSDLSGGYRLPDLPVCVYSLKVELQGFKTLSREVQVAVGSTTRWTPGVTPSSELKSRPLSGQRLAVVSPPST